MRMGRFILGSLAFLFSAGALAVPITHAFTGTITHEGPLSLVTNGNQELTGIITFDAETGEEPYCGIDWGCSYLAQKFIYQISMRGQLVKSSYGWDEMTANYSVRTDGSVEFFDEVPSSDLSYEYGQMIFHFRDTSFSDLTATAALPIDKFIGGSIVFGGGIRENDPLYNQDNHTYASIDSLVRVPEPASAALFSLGLLGLLVSRRRPRSHMGNMGPNLRSLP